jgi:hypothetical protein
MIARPRAIGASGAAAPGGAGSKLGLSPDFADFPQVIH